MGESAPRPSAFSAKPSPEAPSGAPAGPPAERGCTEPAPFVHLHVHSNFSFLDGASRVEELASRAAELGQTALALTDHDGLYGVVRFAKACEQYGIKPIFGVEVQVESLLPSSECACAGKESTEAATASAYHLVLLAETREGYANLCRLVSAAHLAVPERDRPPVVTRDSLHKHREGVICLTGCRHGEVGTLIDAGRAAAAQVVLEDLRQIFGPRHLFIELQHFGYRPPREADAGRDGAPVYRKRRGDNGRLHHHRVDRLATPSRPTALHYNTSAISIAFSSPSAPPPSRSNPPVTGDRPELPPTRLHHLDPADFDIGFHPDGRPWALSCDSYCHQLLMLAHVCDLPTVLTTNAHYARPEERALHLVCRAAGHDQPLSGYPRPVPGSRCLRGRAELEVEIESVMQLHKRHSAIDIALRSAGGTADRSFSSSAAPLAQMSPLAQVSPLALMSPLDAPALIAARCNVDLDLGIFHFPKVEVPPDETAYSLLAKRCFRGIARRYKPVPPRAVELLEHELAMIERMGFAHYFLVVHDIVRFARNRGIACSGRGSAGNSIVCYALDITASEPIRHHLLFERFLNPNRREMPDIDVDFCSVRRDEVIDYIYRTFGDCNVAVVANVNTMSPRSAVRIVAEALGFAPTDINALAKHVPRHGDAARIREYLAGAWPELHDSPLQDESRYGPLLDLVERLDGFPLHLGTHLGGFVIADRPITYYAPLQWAAKGVVVLQFNKDDVAALGLVKMDILGLRTHSAVSECVHLIRQRTGRRIHPYELSPDDPAAYEIISNGGSIGLFQLESAGQRNLASRLRERDFDDVIAAIALYRPGPLEAEMIGPFIDRRWGLEPVTLPHPAMAEAVNDTYGVILYQEQVLRIAHAVAGFDLADADTLRRAMTRDRSREEMAKIGETFVTRAVARGVPEEAAREVFRQLEGFAAYGFNKSHSVCFAVIAYATAYLKARYPAEFLCAVLNNQPMGFYTPRTVLNDARRFGLEVRPLDINLSGRGFTVEDEVPPDPWAPYVPDPPGAETEAAPLGTGAQADQPRNGEQTGAPRIRTQPYNPFAFAWTEERRWGLSDEDLGALRREQNGEGVPIEALSQEWQARPGDHAPTCKPQSDKHPATGPKPGDLALPRASRARGGVAPGTCLCPEGAPAPGAGRAVRVGFSQLKQMSERALRKIEEERVVAPFVSFEDFYLRTRVEYPVAENLIRVGAFDSVDPDRTELLWRLPLLHDRLSALAAAGGNSGQLRAFFAAPEQAGLKREWTIEDRVRSELELLGLTVTCHPLSLYESALDRLGVTPSWKLPQMGDEVPVLVAGVYERAQNPWMRSGKRTMFLTLEDAYGLFECVLFESTLPACAPVVARATYFLVRGRLQNNRKRGLAVVVEDIWDLEEVLAEEAEREEEVYGDGFVSGRKRPPGAGTTAIPKKVG